MQYEMVVLEEKSVIGLMKKTTNQDGKALTDIGMVWQTFFGDQGYAAIPNKKNAKTIGLYTDYEGDFTAPYHFLACCETEKDTGVYGALVKRTIAAGKYAKFIVTGDVQRAVGAFWSELWQKADHLGFERGYTYDFEEYQNISEDMTNQEIHIYISVK